MSERKWKIKEKKGLGRLASESETENAMIHKLPPYNFIHGGRETKSELSNRSNEC